MVRDLRYACRTFRRHKLTAVIGILTLGLGIGGATAVFSVVNTVVLQPLPFANADRLLRVWQTTPAGERFSFSDADFLDLQMQRGALAASAAYREIGTTMVIGGDIGPQRVAAIAISASMVEVLGVQPALGRLFSADEDRPRGERRVVLSDRLWRTRFAGDAGVLGRPVVLDGAAHVVTGVMPATFDFPAGADAWVPLRANPLRDRDDHELAVVARLAPGATLAAAQDELRALASRLGQAHASTNAGWGIDAAPLSEWVVPPRFRDALWVLLGAVALLLLLACTNVANLLVAHAATRHNEMRVRAAIGAGRWRLVRQLFTEAALLASIGTALGVLIAIWSIDAVRVFGAGRIPRIEELRIDAVMLAVASSAGVVSCLLFGIAPALHGAAMGLGRLTDDGSRSTAGHRRVRQSLIVVEVALALLLLVGAGLLGTSFVRLIGVDHGFDAGGVLTMPIELPPAYNETRVIPFYAAVIDRIRVLPGVEAVAATSTNPFRQFGFSNTVTPEERAADAPPTGLLQAGWRSVTPDFFRALRIPLRRGRTFTDSDLASAPHVVVVSQSLADRLWPGGDPIGQRIFWGGTTGTPRTVVGVTGDILDVRLDAEVAPMLFVPHAQVDLPAMTVIIRSSLDAAAMAPALRDVLRQTDASLPPADVEALVTSRDAASAGQRFNFWLLTAFAAIAFALAVSGVYAMLAFSVAERRREVAVRLALGASARAIISLFFANGVKLAALGVTIGTLAALAVTRLIASVLYDVTPTDGPTFIAAAGSLMIAAAIASYVPVRRAMRADPISILRQ
ncbi:MAG TPA: ABC transporter permease [Vicinamibacterales bacterium]|nr:ABC transporter permease [Vicinamibacterales bacterium]